MIKLFKFKFKIWKNNKNFIESIESLSYLLLREIHLAIIYFILIILRK
jgi:hypothetical protein